MAQRPVHVHKRSPLRMSRPSQLHAGCASSWGPGAIHKPSGSTSKAPLALMPNSLICTPQESMAELFYNQPSLALIIIYQCHKVKAEVGRSWRGHWAINRVHAGHVSSLFHEGQRCPYKLTICPQRLNASIEQDDFLSKNPGPGNICLMSLQSRA